MDKDNKNSNLDIFTNMRSKKKSILDSGDTTDDIFDGEDFIGNALDAAGEESDINDKKTKEALKKKASKKRQETNKIKKKAGIRPPKQSKHATRSHDFLKEESVKALHVVLNKNQTKIYMDGADICHRILMGIPAFNKPCKKNAFNHLITIQEKIQKARGTTTQPLDWVIISNDTSMIMDRNLLTRLNELKENTHIAGAYGFERVRSSGKWYQLENAEEQTSLRGCYIQANMSTSSPWSFYCS